MRQRPKHGHMVIICRCGHYRRCVDVEGILHFSAKKNNKKTRQKTTFTRRRMLEIVPTLDLFSKTKLNSVALVRERTTPVPLDNRFRPYSGQKYLISLDQSNYFLSKRP
jgi:hypothetical protein